LENLSEKSDRMTDQKLGSSEEEFTFCVRTIFVTSNIEGMPNHNTIWNHNKQYTSFAATPDNLDDFLTENEKPENKLKEQFFDRYAEPSGYCFVWQDN
jgi:hypothetical protein